MNKIYTSYYGNIKNILEEYDDDNKPYFISISRYIPVYLKNFINEQNLKLAPSNKLLKEYKTLKIPEKEKIKYYINNFHKELEKIDLKKELENIVNILKKENRDVYLLCYESPTDFCHRHIIAKLFNEIIIKNKINIDLIKEKNYENINFSINYKIPNTQEIIDDIFSIKSDATINPVNTVGIMGKGLALEFKNRYPKNYEEYKKACENKKLDIGKILPVKENDKWIINFPTKKHWKNKSQYKYIEKGMDSFLEWLKDKEDIKTIAIPALGSGLGGLDWKKVKEIIENKILYYSNKYPELQTKKFILIPPFENKLKLEPDKPFLKQKGLEFLSNMFYVPIKWKGYIFPSSENIYQFEKLPEELKNKYIEQYLKIKSNEAKKLGRKLPLRKDWEEVKLKTMFEIVKEKFLQNPDLKNKLVNIEGPIIEYNYWNDTFWGYDVKKQEGKNYLGKILEYLRKEFSNNNQPTYENFIKDINNKEDNRIRIAVVGSRTYNNYEEFKKIIDKFISAIKNRSNIQEIIIISGGAKGADSLAQKYANENNIKIVEILPDWKKFGKSAGFKRNIDIWNNSDIGIAFWDGKSKGTAHSIKISKEQKKDLLMYIYPEKKWKLYNNNNFIINILKNKNIEIIENIRETETVKTSGKQSYNTKLKL